ncbi:MAG: hypothetical protein E7104_00445 [Prevotella sp.]|nr:hypothetical protein [Prevotella sp.]
MIKVEDILNATNGGLDIILEIYPQAKCCVNAKNKHFAIRDERTPSASLRQYDSKTYGRIWQVTDFGGDGRGENAISVYMRENGIDRSRFNEALLQLAAKYNVKDELNHAVNKPDIRQRDANQDEADGSRSFELNDKFTDFELKTLGPRVTQADVDALHWHSVKWITNVKDRKTTVKHSNEHYPIFIRECLIKKGSGDTPDEKFYKVYEPLNCEKGFRFSYTPAGKKPQLYVNGLSELKDAYIKYNKEERLEWERLHDDEQPYKEKKLPEAFICSGERDSLCCRSMGYAPLWFNSETYHLSVEEYKEIMKYVEVLYNIPDIDDTGRRKGKELALRFIDIHTIWLPNWLGTYKDNRGHARKDLRDWMELRSEKKDFKNLMKVAMPAKFWVSYMNKDGKWKHEIDTACLYNFLQLNGFYALHDENSSVTQYVRVEGNIVKHITVKDIREFVTSWVRERYEERDILNLVLNTPKLSSAALESLQEISLDFTSYTNKSQLFFFPNKTVEVVRPEGAGDDGFREYTPGSDDLQNYVWEDNVIDHKFKKQEDAFKIIRTKDEQGRDQWDIDIKNVNSHFFGYLINTSRIYWRKEMEYRFHDDQKAMEEYKNAHPFDIAGEGLTAEEIGEQKLNLINKIFAFGYMMHHFKSPERAWAPYAMDNKIGDDNECNGRSGKSFFFKTLSILMKTVKLSGRNPKLMDNPHVFDQVNQHTRLLLLDDCDRYLNTGLFYDNITSDMTVNPKNNQSFTIDFEDSPKLAFTTNYVPSDFDPSSEARLIYMVFSDYYHQKTEDNDYLETRTIRDDFGKPLYTKGYTEEEWLSDLNFWLQCCRFYLSISNEMIKIIPPMSNIIKRKFKADMGANFEDWAYGYFSKDGENLDTFLQRDKVFDEYRQYANTNKITMQNFSRKLKAFANLCPWIADLNPEELCNSSGRIQHSIEIAPGLKKTKDMIYLKSREVEDDAEQMNNESADLFCSDEDADKPF